MSRMEERKASRVAKLLPLLSLHGDALKEREREILTRYYGIGRPVETMSVMSREMGLSMNRVRQLRVEAEDILEKLDANPGTLRGAKETKRQKLLERRARAKEALDKIDAEIAALYDDRLRADVFTFWIKVCCPYCGHLLENLVRSDPCDESDADAEDRVLTCPECSRSSLVSTRLFD